MSANQRSARWSRDLHYR